MSVSLQILSLPEGEILPRREIAVPSCPFVIGRDFDCDLSLPDSSSTLSRRHLQIDGAPFTGYRVTDLSRNGTMLNGTSIHQQGGRPVADGDVVEFAGYRLLISVTSRPSAPVVEPAPAPKPEMRPMSLSPLEVVDDMTAQPGEEAEEPFGGDIKALEADLLFDPFEDGPGLRDTPVSEAQADKPAPYAPMDAAPIVSRMGFPDSSVAGGGQFVPMGLTATAAQDPRSAALEREELSGAIDRAVARFLDQFDPAELEKEYRDFLGPFARRKHRYWSLFHKQFRRRRENGDYGRTFRAILAEEIRRK
ncbi:type VI secretion system-associated FHA domain protein [Yoonia vestfoldensis]|uniref:FHA domain protein n=1 Tax=Yoonia vestfoldensis TaxID=245188 RepID=A0A1Y0EFI2_9RHOB|nr:FHA domain-containing protein [Yoonia vestfoldensis]ARU02383.1 FHA domain protein [Yoonia vestfoldensis]